MNGIDKDTPREVWAYLVDCEGTRLTEEQHVVLMPNADGTAETAMDRTFASLPGMEDREPAAIAMRFADGHVTTGELPDGGWEQVEIADEEEDES